METSANPQEEEDDFFGDDGHDDGNGDDYAGLAEQESKAVSAQLSNIAYLEAFEEHKEVRLQEGFEAGYRDVFAIALRLGCRLGEVSAQSKLRDANHPNRPSPDAETSLVRQVNRRFRAVMDQINQGASDKSEDAKVLLLLKLEEEVNQLRKK